MADGRGGDCNSDIAVRPIRKVLLISAGASHSVALLSERTLGVRSKKGFGKTMMQIEVEEHPVQEIEGHGRCTSGLQNVINVIAAGNVVCSWGRGEDGQLGLGDAEDRFSPTQVSALDGQEIVSLTCGADHTTAYSEALKQVYSWGWGDFGRLGHGNSSDLFTPQPIKALHGIRIKQIACGDSHCLAVTMEGEVQSWGRNQNGQLGLGTTEDSLVPRKIEAFKGIPVKMVAAGAEHTAAVTEDGELYGWGWGRYGNLGLGDRNDRLVPEKVSANVGEKMFIVACGWRHTICVSSSGALYTYGWSKYGQLGHGDFEDHLFPHKVQALHESFTSQPRHTKETCWEQHGRPGEGIFFLFKLRPIFHEERGWKRLQEKPLSDGIQHFRRLLIKLGLPSVATSNCL
ncbi:hypothetical protein MTR67_022870 [Solanum verrucosum]|uniref:RCC1-like domain-containing protein n=1 Tax=Solanum verrucosum TaxID=315347 RepID=A0AAF0TX48_SOLVR|nr:hypothetical protein MTR67_022870 [Solanum verrucosum]